MDLSVMMKYKRKKDCWVCPLCENENPDDTGKCYLCGYVRTGSEIFLRAWTPEDDARERTEMMRNQGVNPIPNQIPPVRPVAPPPPPMPPRREERLFEDEERIGGEEFVPKKKRSKAPLIIIIIAIIAFIVGAFFFLLNNSRQETYDAAIDYYNSEQYQEALNKFEELPDDYKDVDERKKDTKYLLAKKYLAERNVESARELFTELGSYSDSKDMLTECDYVAATLLLEGENYDEAREAFKALGDYSDSADMINECDYQQATDYYNSSDYVKAMGLFYSLGYYRDSKRMLNNGESGLLRENRNNYRYEVQTDLIGDRSDSDGNYVEYTQSDYNMHAEWSMASTSGSYFKVEDGIHYHGSDYYWTKQWIFEYISYNEAYVFNYIDGKVYTFSR